MVNGMLLFESIVMLHWTSLGGSQLFSSCVYKVLALIVIPYRGEHITVCLKITK